MLNLLMSISLFLFLLFMHELGHYISARAMGLKVTDMGFAAYPLPHPYVAVSDVPDGAVKYIFLYAGPLMTACLFTACMVLGLLAHAPVYYAFAVLMVMEYNPFHSDFTISIGQAPRNGFQGRSGLWYLCFLLWTSFTVFLLAPQGLRYFVV